MRSPWAPPCRCFSRPPLAPTTEEGVGPTARPAPAPLPLDCKKRGRSQRGGGGAWRCHQAGVRAVDGAVDGGGEPVGRLRFPRQARLVRGVHPRLVLSSLSRWELSCPRLRNCSGSWRPYISWIG